MRSIEFTGKNLGRVFAVLATMQTLGFEYHVDADLAGIVVFATQDGIEYLLKETRSDKKAA